MSGYWSIVVPEATKNYVKNPSFHANITDDWTTVAGTTARSTANRMFGLASLSVTAAGAGTDAVVRTTAAVSLAAGATMTVSCYAYLTTALKGGGIFLRDETGGTTERAYMLISVIGQWARLTATWTNSTANPCDMRLLLKNTAQDSATVMYFDGLQMELKAYATTFCDGSQPGCVWDGLADNGTSSRPVTSRAGGRIVDLSDYNLFVNMVGSGLGMPSMKHITSGRALLPGALFQRRQVEPQTLSMTIMAQGTSRNNLHSVRKDLIDFVKPDATPSDDEFGLLYQGSLSSKLPAELRVRYDSGLEWTSPEAYLEYIPLRVIAYDPFWREQGNDASVLATEIATGFDANYVLQCDLTTGVWSALGTGMDGTVDALMVGYTGTYLYAGGDFDHAGGVDVNHVAKWDIEAGAWSAMGATPGTNGRVRALCQTADTYVYAGGDFTKANGTTTDVNYIARWNGTVWAAMGATPGTDAAVYALQPSSTHYLLVGGAFANAGGAGAARIAKWTGSAWAAFAAGIPDGTVYTIADWGTSTATVFFVGGSFNTTYDYAAYWGGAAWYTLAGDDFNGAVRRIQRGTGVYDYYYFGDFTANGTITDAYSVQGTNITAGTPMGSGLNAAGWCSARNPLTGDLYVGGDFTTAGGVAAPMLAKWNGSTWSGLGITLPGTPTVTAMAINPTGTKLFVGFDEAGAIATGTTPGTTTVTNLGTATTYPVIRIKRAGGTSATIRNITNSTQGTALYSNYAMRDGETITIDLTDKTVTSDYTGSASVIGEVIERNSDFGKFGILPGANVLSCLVETAGSPTVTAWLEWKTTHWSADGAAA